MLQTLAAPADPGSLRHTQELSKGFFLRATEIHGAFQSADLQAELAAGT